MRWFISMNVGFVGVLSCLVLVLALFFSTSVASAQSTHAAVHSQTSVTSVSTLKGESKGPYQACRKVYVKSRGSYGGRYYPSGGYVTVCGRNGYYNGYYGGYSGCNRVYVSRGNYRGIYYGSGGYVTVCGRSGYSGRCRRVYVPSGYSRGIYYQYGGYIALCQ